MEEWSELANKVQISHAWMIGKHKISVNAWMNGEQVPHFRVILSSFCPQHWHSLFRPVWKSEWVNQQSRHKSQINEWMVSNYLTQLTSKTCTKSQIMHVWMNGKQVPNFRVSLSGCGPRHCHSFFRPVRKEWSELDNNVFTKFQLNACMNEWWASTSFQCGSQ